jgi:hypothetical protein
MIVSVPSTVKFPCILTPASVTVISVLPSQVSVTAPFVPVSDTTTLELACVIVVDDKDDTESSTYFLLAKSPSLDGAPVSPPVIVLADADITISPHDKPVFTLKFLVVMVPISPA